MHIQEFDYELPEGLIAQRPSEKRENSKKISYFQKKYLTYRSICDKIYIVVIVTQQNTD